MTGGMPLLVAVLKLNVLGSLAVVGMIWNPGSAPARGIIEERVEVAIAISVRSRVTMTMMLNQRGANELNV